MAEDSEVLAFTRLVNSVRRSFCHTDEANNPGFVESARIDSVYPTGTSVKLVVYNGVSSDKPAKSSVVKFCPDGEERTRSCLVKRQSRARSIPQNKEL